jgi:hypothetical protein
MELVCLFLSVHGLQFANKHTLMPIRIISALHKVFYLFFIMTNFYFAFLLI